MSCNCKCNKVVVGKTNAERSEVRQQDSGDNAVRVMTNIAIGIGIVLLVVTVIGVPLLRVLFSDGRYGYYRRYW